MGNSMSISNPELSSRLCFEKIFGPPPGKFCETTHGTTHYILENDTTNNGSQKITKRPLVILQHGLGGDSGLWDRVAKDLVADGYRVLRYDLYDRGYSESDPKRYPIHRMGVHPLTYTLDVYTQQLGDVLKHLSVSDNEPIIHVGHSLGGLIGIAYSANHPEQVKGLVLVDAVCLPVTKPLLAKISNLPVVGDLLAARFGVKTFQKFSRGSVVDPDNHPTVSKFLKRLGTNTETNPRYFSSIRSTNQHCKGMVGSAEEEYRQCCTASIPIHLLWGKADTSVPYANCCEMKRIAEEIGTDVTEESFEGMPHNVFFEDAKPEECSKSILDFASKVTAAMEKSS